MLKKRRFLAFFCKKSVFRLFDPQIRIFEGPKSKVKSLCIKFNCASNERGTETLGPVFFEIYRVLGKFSGKKSSENHFQKYRVLHKIKLRIR